MTYPGNDIDLGKAVGSGERIILSRQDRARHTFAVGASRTGKTKLLEGICRQDLLQWAGFQCPVVIIDPHGTLVDGLLGYAAAEGLDEWPIVPFDLRRNDLVVSYNLLRERQGVDAAVICRDFVDAILHAWKQTDTNATPRLGSWLQTLLMLAYERECTLAEALAIINTPDLRAAITVEVRDMVTRSVLQSTGALRESDVQDRLESTLYRINRFLSTQLLRATICQAGGETLDMSRVLSEGLILPVCLSTEGSKITAEDAATLGSILVSDLWTSAQRRGKREEGSIVPCYVHIDEFQNFITPGIAKGLSQSSGFGIHFTLAHQYPSQLPEEGGELGRMILGSVLANVRNRIAFQISYPQDLELMASVLFRQTIDPDRIKDEIWTTKVLGHEIEYLRSYGTSSTEGSSSSVSRSRSAGRTRSRGTSRSKGQGRTSSENQADTTSETASNGESWQESSSTSEGETAGSAHMEGTTRTYGPPTVEFQDERRNRDADDEDEFERRWATGLSESAGTTDATSRNRGSSRARADGGSTARSVGLSRTHGQSAGESTSEAAGASESEAHQVTESVSQALAESSSTTDSESWSPVLIPQMGKELSSRQYESIADQMQRFMQFLDGQPDRHCVVRLASMRQPVLLRTTTVSPPLTVHEYTDAWIVRALLRWPFVLPMSEAERHISGRLGSLRARVLGHGGTHEPIIIRRKLMPPLPPPGDPRDGRG